MYPDPPHTPASNSFAPVVSSELNGGILLKQQYWVRRRVLHVGRPLPSDAQEVGPVRVRQEGFQDQSQRCLAEWVTVGELSQLLVYQIDQAVLTNRY